MHNPLNNYTYAGYCKACEEAYEMGFEDGELKGRNAGYNKAIDDFVAYAYINGIDFSFMGKIKEDGTSDVPDRLNKIKDRFHAERLKRGGENEIN